MNGDVLWTQQRSSGVRSKRKKLTARKLSLPQKWCDMLAFYHATRIVIISSFFQSVLHWSVAVFTICRHSSRVVPFSRQSRRQSSDDQGLGLPTGRFRSGCTCQIAAARARWWSSRDELRALWPKSHRRLLVTKWESGEQPVVFSDFRIWHVASIRRRRRIA